MGCDGGTIPRRDELVRLKKKPEQKDKDAEREFRWLHCFLSQQRLQEPIVMCGLGRLYSKQSVIEQLLEKDKMPDTIKHIKSLKDVKQLNLTANPAYTDADKAEGLLDDRQAPYICKLIGLEMSGKFRFVALWNCGCVMSERALKEIKGTSSGGNSICPICQQSFAIEDVIILNAMDEDLEMMQLKMEMRNAKRKANKKEKKEKKQQTCNKEFSTIDNDNSNNNNNEASTSQERKNSVSKSKLSINCTKRLNNCSNDLDDPDLKRLKTVYSVAKDPKATDVYKSLFTTHKTEKEQNRAHWITYNPFYN